ncbi:MAG: YjbF family lipoprotein [Paracoccaceae bacterium]
MSWLKGIALGVLLFCTGCSSQDDVIADSLSGIGRKKVFSDPRIEALQESRSAVLQIAFLELEASGVLLRETSRDGRDTWISVEGASIILEKGMIVGARGVGSGMMASDVSQSLNAIYSGQSQDVVRFHSFLTENDEIETRSYKCAVESGGRQDMTLVDRKVNARVMRESCQSLDQTFLNIYWFDPTTGRLIQSRQWMGGNVGVVILRELAV